MKLNPIKPSLIIFTGPMFSEKTTEAIRIARRYKIAGRKVVIFAPSNDNRSAKDKIASSDKNGPSEKAITIDCDRPEKMMDYLEKNRDIEIVFIDEIQFFSLDNPSEMKVIIEFIINTGRKVYAIGLKADFNQDPFGCLQYLMVLADKIHTFTAICNNCGDEDASISKRKVINEGEQVVVGGKELYTSICRRCDLGIKDIKRNKEF